MKTILAVCTLACAAITLFCVLVVLLRTKKCPPDKILVVYGNVGKDKNGNKRTVRCVHGGAVYVLPFVQHYFYLDLTPISVPVEIGEEIEISATFAVAVSTEPEITERAAERLMGLGQAQIKEIAENILLGQLRLAAEGFEGDRDKFMQEAAENAEKELNKVGLRIVNAAISKFNKL